MEKVTKVTLEALLSDIDDVAKKLAAVRGAVVGLIPPPEEPTPVEVGFDALVKRGSSIGSFGVAALNGLPHGPKILDTLDGKEEPFAYAVSDPIEGNRYIRVAKNELILGVKTADGMFYTKMSVSRIPDPVKDRKHVDSLLAVAETWLLRGSSLGELTVMIGGPRRVYMLREELDRVKVTIAVRENDKAFQRILDAGDEGMYRVVTRDIDLRGDTVYLVHSSVDDLKEREKPIFVSTTDPDYEDCTEALFYLVFGRTPAIRTPPVEDIA